MSEFDMGLEDLREDLEGNDWAVGEDGETIQPIEGLDDQGTEEKLANYVALESLLVKEGKVSRSVAETFQDLLPAGVMLQSFTVEPTKVNHKMATESIGTAIKVAALAGVAVLIGGLGMVIYRILKRRKELPNNELAKKITAAFASVDSKLKTGVDELKSMFPSLEHPQLNWTRSEAIVRVASSMNIKEIDVRIMEGNYGYLDSKTLQVAVDQGKRINDFIVKNVLPTLKSLATAGTGEDLDALDKTISEFTLGEELPKAIKVYVSSLKIEVGEDPIVSFREEMLKDIPSDKISERISNIDPQFKEVDVKGQTALLKVKSDLEGTYKSLESIANSLKGKKGEVSSNYHTRFKELIVKVQAPLKSLDGIFEIREQETAGFNRLNDIKAKTVSDGFKTISESYLQKANSDKENAGKYKDCVNHLKKLFANIKESVK